MNVLILTGNGREHALATMYAKSKKVKKVVMIPGNGLSEIYSKKIKNYEEINPADFDDVLKICKKEQINFVDVSQDDIIAAGYVDKLQKAGIKTFGPTQKASQIEWDKAWAREFMKKYNLPIPEYKTFSNTKKAITYIKTLPEQILFIKASGLAGGKGVIKAKNKTESIAAIQDMKQFGTSGDTFVIEKALIGEEFSLFALCDGKIIKEVEEKILIPFMHGMQKENRPYEGILYLGGMLTKNGVRIIEFNARLGDPEAEVLLPAIQTDYMDIINAVLNKKLVTLRIQLDNKKRISVCGCSFGYPGDYKKVTGMEIFGIPEVIKIPGVTIYGAGIKKRGERFFANGGRLFHLVAEGNTILDTRKLAYQSLSMIYIEGNNLHYRTDIGWGEVERFYQ